MIKHINLPSPYPSGLYNFKGMPFYFTNEGEDKTKYKVASIDGLRYDVDDIIHGDALSLTAWEITSRWFFKSLRDWEVCDGAFPFAMSKETVSQVLEFIESSEKKENSGALTHEACVSALINFDYKLLPLLDLGMLVVTPGANEAITKGDIITGLELHANGDWGNVCAEDQQTNNKALKNGYRVVSCYPSVNGCDYWIITEADRSVTTILLPEEY